MSDVPVNVESPEDRERALAIERAEVARTIQAQVQANEAAQWTQHIEPDARHYYETNQRAEIALLLSIAISLMRTAGGKPYPGTEPEPQDDEEIPLLGLSSSEFVERWPSEPREVRVRTIPIRLEPRSEPELVSVTAPPPREESSPVSINRPLAKRRVSDICTRHGKRKVVYLRRGYKHWRCR